jgi:hypothetical protein
VSFEHGLNKYKLVNSLYGKAVLVFDIMVHSMNNTMQRIQTSDRLTEQQARLVLVQAHEVIFVTH